MKKHKMTRFLPVALAMLLCFFCTACGGSSGNNSGNNNGSNNVNSTVNNTTNNNANNGITNNNTNNNVNNGAANNTTNNGGSIAPQDDPNEGLGGNVNNNGGEYVNEVGMYEGLWLSVVADEYDYLQIDAEGNLQLYSEGYVLDEGYLWYDSDWDVTYIESTLDGFLDGSYIEMDGGQIYIEVCGYFDYLDGRGGQWQGAAGGSGYAGNDDNGGYDNGGNDSFYSWNSELCQRNVSEFEGTWYYEGDYSAMSYIVIDRNGNWSYYERATGDPEATRMDYGTLSYSADEVSTYYADSSLYSAFSIRVFEFDEGVIIWGEDGTYYRLE